MTGIAEQIILFYVLGMILFIIGMEDKRVPNTFIYLGLSFVINLMGYYRSYIDSDFVTTAYLPLILTMLSVVFLLYHGFEQLKLKTNDSYKTDDE